MLLLLLLFWSFGVFVVVKKEIQVCLCLRTIIFTIFQSLLPQLIVGKVGKIFSDSISAPCITMQRLLRDIEGKGSDTKGPYCDMKSLGQGMLLISPNQNSWDPTSAMLQRNRRRKKNPEMEN